MRTQIAWPWELPKVLEGIAVVCDVWGATTNINTLLAKGVNRLLIVNINNVQKAKDKYKDTLVVGESLKLPKTFFNASNYPDAVAKVEAKNKTILYMSNNGSRIIELALKKGAKKVITVSFTNITSVNEYFKDSKGNIYLIPSGDIGSVDQKVEEDLICVKSLNKLLKGKNVDLNKAQEKAKAYIETNYADETFDHNLNFEIVFNLNSSKVVPICSQETEGWIKVEDLNQLVKIPA